MNTKILNKAKTFKTLGVVSKEPMNQRFKQNKGYWDYTDYRDVSRNMTLKTFCSYFNRCLEKHLGKSFEQFRNKIVESDFYKHNKMIRKYAERQLKELGSLRQEFDMDCYFIDSDYLISKFKYQGYSRSQTTTAIKAPTTFEITLDGITYLFKNGLYYKKSLHFTKLVRHSKFVAFGRKDLQGVTISPFDSWLSYDPIWQQMSKREIKQSGLLNRDKVSTTKVIS